MNNVYIFILIMALVTYLIRAIPIVVLKKEIKNKFTKSFLYYVPYVALAAMTFPAIIYSTRSVISGGIGLLVTILASKKNNLLFVAICACLAVFITELFI